MSEHIINTNESFRDTISTISKEGKRSWIYPKKPAGRFYKARTIVSIILLGLLFGGPFMRVHGHPLMLFNVIERKFILFGIPFWPQDFFLFMLAMLTFIVFIILFTVIFGRVWCGWACPQTFFL
jgi:polyferredoxin